MTKGGVVVALLCVLFTGSAQAQDVKEAAVTEQPVVAEGGASVSEQPVVDEKAPNSEVSEEREEGNVSLDFVDADIRNVLKILSLKSGLNIVTSPEVSGAISIQLTDVPWKQALEVILETYGYAYEQKGNVIMVTTVEDLRQRRENAAMLAEQEPLVTKIFTLNFAKASDIIASLEKMKSERGNLDFDARTNTIIATDVADKIALMADIVRKLDRTTPQILIEAKILKTTFSDTDKLGIDWVTQATISGSKRPTQFPLLGGDTDTQFLPGNYPSTTSTDFSYGTLDFSATQAVFEMLKTRSDTEVLSNPRIVTMDNQPATISVATEHPIPSYGANPETGALQVIGLSWRPIGINFKVTPHVNNAGYVTLDLLPEVSSTSASVSFENISVPLISVEKAETSIMIKGGETLVIAGLISDTTSETRKKTPFLGDVPVIGLLFQKKEKTKNKTDLLIFITPHIITPKVEAEY